MRKSTLGNLFVLLMLTSTVAYPQVDVLMQHNDVNRTGWNSQETSLTTSNVGVGTFGKLYTRQMDDEILAQPLVVTGVTISGNSKNIVIVATVNNSIYAFDADNAAVTTPYWQVNLTETNMRPPQNTDIHAGFCPTYLDFPGRFGIVGTPVIDKTHNTMYIVSRSTDGTSFHTYLHAIDIRTGSDVIPRVEIMGSVSGTGDGTTTVTFNSLHQNQRPGLILLNGVVYIGFASHCDWNPYHGWLFGYDASTLQQKIIFCTTPNGQGGGIWGCGAAPAVDEMGNIYLATGNGDVGTTISDPNKGETALKLTPDLTNHTFTVQSYFLPYNYPNLDANDLDFGVTESLLIPGSHMVLAGCKDGNLYFMNGDNMGGFNSGGPNLNQQTISLGQNAALHASLAYYNNGTGNEYVYVLAENSALKAIPYNRGSNSFGTPITSGIQGPSGQSGAFLSVSSNGSTSGTGILWVSHAVFPCNANQAPQNGLCQGILRALDANDVTHELWNSNNSVGDTVGLYAKFVCPTIANGKVYMVTFSGKLVVYGVTGADPCAGMQNVALSTVNPAAKYSASSSVNGTTPAMAFDGNLSTAWNAEGTDGYAGAQSLTVDLGSPYNLCRVEINWGAVWGGRFTLQGSNDNTNYTTIQSISDNTSQDNIFSVSGLTYRYIRMQGMSLSNYGNGGYVINEMSVYGQPSNGCVAPTGLTSSNITQTSATVSWTPVSGATSYNLQYKTTGATAWTSISQTTTSASLSGLACGSDYLYQVETVCASGSSLWSTASAFSTNSCSVSCTLPTRWTSEDIGAVGAAGSACDNNDVYTIQGSGADIGGTSDAFHYAHFALPLDESIIATVETQDATDPSNKAGIMIRETTDPASRFAFMALTSGSGALFEYRNATGAAAISTFAIGPTAPYRIKLTKTGSVYSGYMSPDGTNWTQVGSSTDLQFGNGTNVLAGFAITSHNNSVLSAAIVDNLNEVTSPLAIKLASFTAQNIDNQYVSIRWTTSMEMNNNYFIVQRSTDGVHFTDLVNVPGAGNSDVSLSYSAEDHNPVQGINYYRLKQVDFDGKFTVSPMVTVRFGQQVAPMLYPNPASSFFTIVAGQEPMRTVSIYDASGKSVRQISNSQGASSLTVFSANLAPGVYIIQVNTTTQHYMMKLIRQ
ncbi:MAG TPA: discoidin domain-containing protein [Puia sp.]|nr:discoidin domain-containing protein [Puia sp.]